MEKTPIEIATKALTEIATSSPDEGLKIQAASLLLQLRD